MKGPAMLLIRNLSQVLLASCHDRKGMGMLHGNKIGRGGYENDTTPSISNGNLKFKYV